MVRAATTWPAPRPALALQNLLLINRGPSKEFLQAKSVVVACNGTVSCAPDSDTSSEVTVGEHADGGSTTQHTSPSAVVHSGLLDCSRREGDQHELGQVSLLAGDLCKCRPLTLRESGHKGCAGGGARQGCHSSD